MPQVKGRSLSRALRGRRWIREPEVSRVNADRSRMVPIPMRQDPAVKVRICIALCAGERSGRPVEESARYPFFAGRQPTVTPSDIKKSGLKNIGRLASCGTGRTRRVQNVSILPSVRAFAFCGDHDRVPMSQVGPVSTHSCRPSAWASDKILPRRAMCPTGSLSDVSDVFPAMQSGLTAPFAVLKGVNPKRDRDGSNRFAVLAVIRPDRHTIVRAIRRAGESRRSSGSDPAPRRCRSDAVSVRRHGRYRDWTRVHTGPS